MTRLALLVRRGALLHDFLIAATTEKPLFRDDATHNLGGIEIASAAVTEDFVGSSIIRARVKSLLGTAQIVVLVADVIDAGGAHARASATLALQPGESRIIELACPVKLTPASLSWSIVPL